MARAINTCQCQLSVAGIDENIENWFVLYICIVKGLTVEASFKAYERGMRKKHNYRFWTDEEKKVLAEELKKGTPTRIIAEILERDVKSVSRYIYQNKKRGNL